MNTSDNGDDVEGRWLRSQREGGVEAGGAIKRHSLRVLIADGDQKARRTIRTTLELEGFLMIEEAENGFELIAMAEVFEPSVVILDQLMPEMNGDEVAPMLKSMLPEVKIVSCSAVVDRTPEWADRILSKSEIADVPALLRAVLP